MIVIGPQNSPSPQRLSLSGSLRIQRARPLILAIIVSYSWRFAEVFTMAAQLGVTFTGLRFENPFLLASIVGGKVQVKQ